MSEITGKLCAHCGEYLPIAKFAHTDKNVKDKTSNCFVKRRYYSSICRNCAKEKKTNKEPQRMINTEVKIDHNKRFPPNMLKYSKTCRICKKRKLLTEFPPDMDLTNYSNSICTECKQQIQNTSDN